MTIAVNMRVHWNVGPQEHHLRIKHTQLLVWTESDTSASPFLAFGAESVSQCTFGFVDVPTSLASLRSL